MRGTTNIGSEVTPVKEKSKSVVVMVGWWWYLVIVAVLLVHYWKYTATLASGMVLYLSMCLMISL